MEVRNDPIEEDMSQYRGVYAAKALSQVPRLLSLQDRNPFSPTYGSFHRRYWLDKVDDFADGLTQFGVQTLALVYSCDFPDNPYVGQRRVRDWAIAGMDYWARIQHRDGTFDEFYPYERGWVGPTAFTTFAIVESFNLLKDEMPDDIVERVLAAVRRAANSIGRGEHEEDRLANHHAMACLALWKSFQLLGDKDIRASYDRVWKGFLRDYQQDEGWSTEYDGVDPGYLSATISFLGKIYQVHPTDEMHTVLEKAVEFASYFVYPNGYYGGSMGSRQTLHFYPHGFEILAPEIPLAAAVVERALQGLEEGALVPPDIQADRYFLYRIPEFLQSYLDCRPRPTELPPLPYQQKPFRRFFPGAQVYAAVDEDAYVLVNAGKGGVIKVFDRRSGQLLYNDCGSVGRLDDGQVISSQWIDPSHQIAHDAEGICIQGQMNEIKANKYFTPLRTILFRSALLLVGLHPRLSGWMKGAIRRSLMLGAKQADVHFCRRVALKDGTTRVTDDFTLGRKVRFQSLQIGGEFFVRYVPQSRYFQQQELDITAFTFPTPLLEKLNDQKRMSISHEVSMKGVTLTTPSSLNLHGDSSSHGQVT